MKWAESVHLRSANQKEVFHRLHHKKTKTKRENKLENAKRDSANITASRGIYPATYLIIRSRIITHERERFHL